MYAYIYVYQDMQVEKKIKALSIRQKSVTNQCHHVLEFFCVPKYTKSDILSDLHKKFQITSVFDTNVEYEI